MVQRATESARKLLTAISTSILTSDACDLFILQIKSGDLFVCTNIRARHSHFQNRFWIETQNLLSDSFFIDLNDGKDIDCLNDFN